jgi:hypothetical protein
LFHAADDASDALSPQDGGSRTVTNNPEFIETSIERLAVSGARQLSPKLIAKLNVCNVEKSGPAKQRKRVLTTGSYTAVQL